jgi:hypothetical protein
MHKARTIVLAQMDILTAVLNQVVMKLMSAKLTKTSVIIPAITLVDRFTVHAEMDSI